MLLFTLLQVIGYSKGKLRLTSDDQIHGPLWLKLEQITALANVMTVVDQKYGDFDINENLGDGVSITWKTVGSSGMQIKRGSLYPNVGIYITPPNWDNFIKCLRIYCIRAGL